MPTVRTGYVGGQTILKTVNANISYSSCLRRDPIWRLIVIRFVIRRCCDSDIPVLTDLTQFMRDQGFSPT